MTPNGELIIRKVETIEDILKQPIIAEVSLEDFEKMSEEMQKEGEENS